MYGHCEDKPKPSPYVSLFQGANDCENTRKGGQIAGIKMLVHQIKRGSSDRKSKESRNQLDRTPAGVGAREAFPAQLPASQEQQENRRKMPDKKCVVERQMGDAHRPRDEVGKQRQPGVGLKKFRTGGEEVWMQSLLNPRQVDLGIFGIGMIAMDDEGCGGDEQQPN